MCILLLMGEMVCLLSSFFLKCGSFPMFHCWFSAWMINPLLRVCYKISHTIIVILSTFPLISFSICLMYFGFWMYIFIIVIPSWCIVLFIIIYWPSLPVVTLSDLKSILSDINMAMPTFFWFLFAWKIQFHFCFFVFYFEPICGIRAEIRLL